MLYQTILTWVAKNKKEAPSFIQAGVAGKETEHPRSDLSDQDRERLRDSLKRFLEHMSVDDFEGLSLKVDENPGLVDKVKALLNI